MRERASQAEVFVPGVSRHPLVRGHAGAWERIGHRVPHWELARSSEGFPSGVFAKWSQQWGVYKLLFGDSPMRVFFDSGVFMSKPSSQQVDILLIGYPCKSISAQNNNAKSFLDESSSSGGGFASLMKFVDVSQPRLVVAENVKNMESKRAKFGGEVPIEIQNKAFERRGYQAFHKTVNSTSFGLRQSRARTWAIYRKKMRFGVLSYDVVPHLPGEGC